jgi:hypothetical protein
MKLCLSPLVLLLSLCGACNAPGSSSSRPSPAAAAQAGNVETASLSVPRVAAAVPQVAPVGAAPSGERAGMPSAAGGREAAPSTPSRVGVSALKVKRLVVTTGVEDREPLKSGDALPADGSAIYAFAELANPVGSSENVRITFERKGGAERVGDVTLPIPANTSRYRTWAFTRYIRTPGVWEAVLWSESGVELERTSFEVTSS